MSRCPSCGGEPETPGASLIMALGLVWGASALRAPLLSEAPTIGGFPAQASGGTTAGPVLSPGRSGPWRGWGCRPAPPPALLEASSFRTRKLCPPGCPAEGGSAASTGPRPLEQQGPEA